MAYVYFPTNSIVSLLYVMENGSSAEIAVVATRASWASPVHGGETMPIAPSCRARARLPAEGTASQAGVQSGGALQHLLLRYTLAMLTQMAQTAVCNRHHSVDQQLCRWLLLSIDA